MFIRQYSEIYEESITKSPKCNNWFVLNIYAKIKVILELKWLTMEERIELSTLIFLFKALHDQQFPKHLRLQ